MCDPFTTSPHDLFHAIPQSDAQRAKAEREIEIIGKIWNHDHKAKEAQHGKDE